MSNGSLSIFIGWKGKLQQTLEEFWPKLSTWHKYELTLVDLALRAPPLEGVITREADQNLVTELKIVVLSRSKLAKVINLLHSLK